MCPVPFLHVRALLALAAACVPLVASAAGLGHAEAVELARRASPALRAQEATLAGSTAAEVAADALPDPRVSAGIENLPIAGPDQFSTSRDPMTMQRLGLMQEVPNRAKREARVQMARSRAERDRATLTAAQAAVRREASLAWLAVHYTERKQALLADVARENRLLQETLAPRIASGMAQPAEMTMARQDALMIADRGDDVARDVRKARAELQRLVGERGAEPLAGAPQLPQVDAAGLRERLHHHADLRPYEPMRAMAAAEMAELEAEKHGDWAWEVAYQRRPRYDDMVSVMLTIDLPWQRDKRQQPAIDQKRREVERIEAERDDMTRRHAAELEAMLAELGAMDRQYERMTGPATQLAAERVALTTSSYQSGRADLGMVLTARAQALELRLRVVDMEAQRSAMRVRLATLIAEE
jgi:outer membrane protein TolC